MKTAAAVEPEPQNRGAIIALSLCMMTASLGASIANIALPTLAREFSAPFHQIQWVIIAYLATMTISVVVSGRLGDIFGLRRMLLIGLFVFSVASLLCAGSPTQISLSQRARFKVSVLHSS